MMIKEIKKNKACPAKRECRRGFVLLFAVTLTAIILSIALGVANITLKEIKFGTSAKDTNEAFFAADTGAEYALFKDKFPGGPYLPGTTTTFVLSGLAHTGQGCAIVTVDKTNPPATKLISKGYNFGSPACNSTSSNLVEREIELDY